MHKFSPSSGYRQAYRDDRYLFLDNNSCIVLLPSFHVHMRYLQFRHPCRSYLRQVEKTNDCEYLCNTLISSFFNSCPSPVLRQCHIEGYSTTRGIFLDLFLLFKTAVFHSFSLFPRNISFTLRSLGLKALSRIASVFNGLAEPHINTSKAA